MAVPVVSAITPQSAVSGTTVTFGLTATNTPTSWAWTFGSWATPTSSVDETPEIDVAGSGAFGGSVIATNGDGSSIPFYFGLALVTPQQALARLSMFQHIVGAVSLDATATIRFKGYLQAVTAMVQRATGRVLVKPPADIEMFVSGSGSGLLYLPEWPLAVVEIRAVSSPDAVAFANDTYRSTTRGNRPVLLSTGNGLWPVGTNNLLLVGRPGHDCTGWDTLDVDDHFGVPPDFENAVCEQALEYKRRADERLTGSLREASSGMPFAPYKPNARDWVPSMEALIRRESRGGI